MISILQFAVFFVMVIQSLSVNECMCKFCVWKTLQILIDTL